MRIFFVFNVLCLALGICYAYTLDKFDILNREEHETARSDLQNQIAPYMGIIAPIAIILFNQLLTRTPSTTTTSTTTSSTTASTTTATTSITTAFTTTATSTSSNILLIQTLLVS